MTTSGGISTLTGIRYQVKVVMYHLIGVLRGDVQMVRYEPRSSALSTREEPSPVHLDDFSVLLASGRKVFGQAKSTEKPNWTPTRLHNEGVLQQFFDQHQEEPEAELRFVSNARSTCLEGLSERARQSVSSQEFIGSLSEKLRGELEDIAGKTATTPDWWWSVLKCVKVLTLNEAHIEQQIRNYASDRYPDAEKLVALLRGTIEERPGAELTNERLLSVLENAGLFAIAVGLSESVKAIFRRSSSRLRTYPDDIAGRHIEREEVGTICAWCTDETSSGAIGLLLDLKGMGKSVILADVLKCLEADEIPVLAIKADTLTEVKDAESLRGALGLPATPERLLTTAVAEAGRAVLLVDQLDALSLTFVKEHDCLQANLSLVARAASIKGVAVVASCRSFDYQFDPNLRSVKTQKEFHIKPLSDEQVQQVLDPLGVDWKALTEDERNILRVPHYLNLFCRAGFRKQAAGPITVHGLYEQLWMDTVQAPSAPARTEEALYVLIDQISETQRLAQPVVIMDSLREEYNYLQSTGILRADGSICSLFHQGFFDYSWARRFVRLGGAICATIKQSPQGFFERPQVLQVLTYLRDVDPAKVLNELKLLIDSTLPHEIQRQFDLKPGRRYRWARKILTALFGRPIRYHLRQLAFDWFGQQRSLTPEEKQFGRQLVSRPSSREQFLPGSRRNAEWFDALQPVLTQFLHADDSTVNDQAVRFLHSVCDSRPSAVFDMLRAQLGRSDEWNNRVAWCLSLHKEWQSAEARDCLLWLAQNTQKSWTSFGFTVHSVIDANPLLACEVVKILLNRLTEDWRARSPASCVAERSDSRKGTASTDGYIERWRYQDSLLPRQASWLHHLEEDLSTRSPAPLLQVIVPWLEDVLPDLTVGNSEMWQGQQRFRFGA